MHHKESRATLGGKLSAVLVAAGSSVGLGNIWRFPYVAGDNGGGAFLIIYILCVLLLGLPLMIAEFTVGRASHRNAVGAYRALNPRWSFLGYNGVLAERNRLLKNMPDETMLRIYDLQLVEQGNRIHALRREFTQRLQPVVADYYRTLSGDREQVELHYKSELNDRPFGEILLAARQKDLANEFTTSGIHRDDLVLRIGGYPLRKYGSQGQQKSFLIALKLAQYTIVAQEKGEKPILLLDDLFDKLDAGRVEQLIRLVSEDSFGQIMITDCNPTRLRTILDKAGGEYALFTVGNGAVTQGNATATAAAADPDKGSAGSRPGNAVTDGAAEPMEEKTPGQTGTAAADRTEGQAGESPAGEPARRPSEPVPAPEPAEEPAAEPDGNGARPGDAASEGGRP